MRKQWSRQIDGAGHVSWKRHFIDSEDFPAAFFVQLVDCLYTTALVCAYIRYE